MLFDAARKDLPDATTISHILDGYLKCMAISTRTPPFLYGKECLLLINRITTLPDARR